MCVYVYIYIYIYVYISRNASNLPNKPGKKTLLKAEPEILKQGKKKMDDVVPASDIDWQAGAR